MMKKIIVSIVVFLMLVGLVACDSDVEKVPSPKPTEDIEVTPTSTPTPTPLQDPDPSWGLFDNVANIEMVIGGLDTVDHPKNRFRFNSKEARDEFIDDIRIIEEAKEMELMLGRYEDHVEDAKEIYNEHLFGSGSNDIVFRIPKYEELWDISCVSLLIEYNDTRNPAKVYEFTDGHPDVFKESKGIKVVYDNEITFYENEDYVITKRVIDMIKDTLYYVHIYYDREYSTTHFLNPYDVKTDDYTIEANEVFDAFLMSYWEDFISKQDFTIYDNGKVVDELPEPDGKKHSLLLVDKKGNTYQYAYDRRDSLKCERDTENNLRYYCKYEKFEIIE